jgi:hypothetical protein
LPTAEPTAPGRVVPRTIAIFRIGYRHSGVAHLN